jgi:DNA-3-methyladenine glycosylase I
MGIQAGLTRCEWGVGNERQTRYHDDEWGVPQRDERVLFEFLVLEGAQAGLSWDTILRKRDGYRVAFDGFDIERIASYDDGKVEALLADPGIVRNRAKVTAAIGNARAWLDLEAPVELLWSFVGGHPQQHAYTSLGELPATTAESDRMSKELKRLGFRFVGSTICYSIMQSCGLVNDHVVSCYRYAECAALAR